MQHRKMLRIADLLGSKIVTAEGKFLNHIVDLEITPGPKREVSALLYGSNGWLYRWHVLHPFVERFGLAVKSYKVPWDAVDRFEGRTITLKAGREPERKSARKIREMKKHIDVR